MSMIFRELRDSKILMGNNFLLSKVMIRSMGMIKLGKLSIVVILDCYQIFMKKDLMSV